MLCGRAAARPSCRRVGVAAGLVPNSSSSSPCQPLYHALTLTNLSIILYQIDAQLHVNIFNGNNDDDVG